MKMFVPVLMLLVLMLLAPALLATPATAQISVQNLPPAKSATPETWVSCSYFDFNHDLSYASRPFKVDANLQANDPQLGVLALGFETAIHGQYNVPVDTRHVECDIIGAWRVDAERQRQQDIDAGKITPAPDERRVDWPRTDPGGSPAS